MQAQLTRSALYMKALNKEARSVDAVLSSETIDGHGDIVDQATLRLERYRQNPVVLWMHNSFGIFDGSRAEDFLPIGKAENIRVAGGQLEARIVFATTPMAQNIFTLFQDGALRAFSIGFRPGRVAEEQTATGRKVKRLLDCELFEVSAVAIPSNPDAVVKFKALGLVSESYQAGAAEDFLQAVNARAFGAAPKLPSTGDAAEDFLRAADQAAERELRLVEGGGHDHDPFDFGGAA